jgi:hypothetical protein
MRRCAPAKKYVPRSIMTAGAETKGANATIDSMDTAMDSAIHNRLGSAEGLKAHEYSAKTIGLWKNPHKIRRKCLSLAKSLG